VRRKAVAYLVPLLLIVISVSACNKTEPDKPKEVTRKVAPLDPWVLTTLDSEDKTPALLWNGLIGIRIGRDGGGKGQPFFSIDEYDTKGEEKIRTLESPLPYGFLLDGKPMPITGDYKQSLDMRTSELTTQWTSDKATVKCVTVLHPLKRMIAQRWSVTGLGTGHILDFDLGSNGHLGSETMLATDVEIGPSKIKGKIIATQAYKPNPSVEFVLSLGRSPNAIDMLAARGIPTKLSPGWDRPLSLLQFQSIDNEASSTWAERWKTDIEIDGPLADQQAVRSFLFYLRSAINPEGRMSISPFGLSNQMYNGHVFWDSDVWVFPALALLDPSSAKAITDYRQQTYAMAKQNQIPGLPEGPITDGWDWKYAWESSVSGKETMNGPSQKEFHISGDVVWSASQAAALGFETKDDLYKLLGETSKTYATESFTSPDQPDLQIRGVMSPDENHVGDNDLYTNLLAQWVVNGGTWTEPIRSARPVKKFRLPHDEKSFLTYDGDPVKAYKQAAAVLSIYPLQYPPAEKQAKVMMERFADKVIKNGPAMSDSVHALIWARIGEQKKAYEAWHSSWQPFTNQPLMLFSEKRTKPTTYFTTGSAGSLQTVLFGFLGFRLDSVTEQGAAWSKQLQGNNWLSIKPNLPQEWKSVKLKNFTVLGHRYTLTASHRPSGPDAAQVIQGD